VSDAVVAMAVIVSLRIPAIPDSRSG
jgi:hypothetical protein